MRTDWPRGWASPSRPSSPWKGGESLTWPRRWSGPPTRLSRHRRPTATASARPSLRSARPCAAIAALLLQGDAATAHRVRGAEPDGGRAVLAAVGHAQAGFGAPGVYRVAVERQGAAESCLDGVIAEATPPAASSALGDRLGRALARPLVGVPALLLVLYVGLYLFVGRFGGGRVVDWLEGTVFARHLNPFFERLFAGLPGDWLRSLFVGDYGLLTLGLRYAVAIILPIVGAFFLFFSVLEDSGYFPRLAL